MKIRPHPGKSAKNKTAAGMALVVTLSLLVLVTIAVMAFFTRATANRMVENSRANQVVARQIAGTASDYVLGSVLSEIPQNASVSGPPGREWYQLTNAVGLLPTRSVAAAATGTNFANLIRQSVPSADASASSHNTAASSQNGRLIPAARWNEPRLNFGDGFANADQLPHWIYLNRDGSTTNTPGADVVGRFAYNVYDVSGLLDANIAGHPALEGTNLSSIKSTQAGADLTALPGVEQTAITALANFRSPGATTPSAFAEGVLEWQKSGFLDPEVNGRRKMSFASRGDLIRYALTVNPGLLPALPFLTHFSLGKSTPVVAVDANDDNIPDSAPLRRPEGATITRYRDDGTSFSRTVEADDIFLDHRFSLAKLAWLTPTGPAPGISPEALQTCFGLRFNSAEKRWDYVGPTGASVRDRIDTLDQVATQNRDPNFFELLYAGIGKESMDLGLGRAISYPGNTGSGNTMENNLSAQTGPFGFAYDSAAFLQAIRIGACIIDQADADNIPTVIRFGSEEIYGLEDLPLLSGFFLRPFYKPTTSDNTFADPRTSLWLVPQLWNPHRRSTASAENIRVLFEGGDINWRFTLTSGGQRYRTSDVNFSLGGEEITMNSAAVENVFRATPNVTRAASGVSSSGGAEQVSHPDWPPQAFLGAQVGEYDGEAGNWDFRRPTEWSQSPLPPPLVLEGASGEYTNSDVSWNIEINNLRISLQVQLPDGSWQTYQTLGGPGGVLSPGLSPTLFNDGLSLGNLIRRPVNHWGEPHLIRAIRSLDPRTSRFGLVYTEHLPPPNGAPNTTEQINIPLIHQRSFFENRNKEIKTLGGFRYQTPLIMANPGNFWGGSPNWWGHIPPGRLWMSGRTGANNNSDPDISYADRDGVRRPSDGYVAAWDANPMYIQATGAANSVTASDRTRPVILQRPFRSVAELGYVFRDQPWKTIDLFSSDSADAALLDLFVLSDVEAGLQAGKIHPVGAKGPVLQSLLRGTPYDDVFARNPSLPGATMTSADAEQISNAFELNRSNLLDRSDLPSLVADNHLSTSGTLAKPSREAALRSLGDVFDFNSWRLFADIIVQTGRFAGDPGATNRFVVEGEERVWLSVLIERRTGKILHLQREFAQ